jgi:antitoxin CcdA
MRKEVCMGYDQAAPRRAVNLSLSEDVVRRARSVTGNLSATVESLLSDFVERELARRRAEDVRVAQLLDGLNALHAEHGLLSDEFSQL